MTYFVLDGNDAFKDAIETWREFGHDGFLRRCVTTFVTDMSGAFSGASSMPVSEWDVSNVTNFRLMFCHAEFHPGTAQESLACWDMSSAKDTRQMFWGARGFCQDVSFIDASDGK